MSQLETTVITSFRQRVTKRLPVERLVLFGSRARGDADSESDLDLLVIVGRALSAAEREFISDCAWEAGLENGVIVMPVVYTQDEWESGPERASLLHRAVAEEGVIV
jgi:uncharacterized protein